MHPQTVKKSNKQFGEGTSGVKKAPKAQSTRRIFIGSIPIDILIAEVMMTSYSEEVTTPKTAKGATFTWYTQLQLGSLHTWDDLQRAFLAQFVSSK